MFQLLMWYVTCLNRWKGSGWDPGVLVIYEDYLLECQEFEGSSEEIFC